MICKINARHYLVIIVGLLFMLTNQCKKEDSSINAAADNLQYGLANLLDSTLNAYRENVPDYPGGLAMKVICSQGSFFVSSGMGQGITEQIHFRAASNSKTFTSSAVLLLYQQGRLDIKHKITDNIPGTSEPYVPDSPAYDIPFKNSITILDLLRHRAGVFDVSNEYIPDTISQPFPYIGQNYIDFVLGIDNQHTFTFEELVNVVAETGLYYFPPGMGYHYSNTGYSILGKIIERVTGQSYQAFLEAAVIVPMGLKNTTVPVLGDDQGIPEPFAAGYMLYEDFQEDVSLSNVSAHVAEGSVITSPADLAFFIRKLLSGQGILSPHTVNSVMMNCLPTGTATAGFYGCGLTYTNNLGYGHNGAHKGYLSMMIYDPASDFTVVIFTNTWNLKSGMNSIAYQLTGLLENTCYQARATVN
jgi:D-alanyl-D-alanine carboxypeptidase